MKVSRSVPEGLVALGVSAGSIIAAAAMTPGASAALVLAQAIGNVGAGIAGNTFHAGVRAGYRSIADRLTAEAKRGRKPLNHDLARALRQSHLEALQYLVVTHLREARADPGDAAAGSRGSLDIVAIEAFSDSALKWLTGELRKTEEPTFFLDAPVDQELAAIDNLEGNGVFSAERFLGRLAQTVSRAAINEFTEAMSTRRTTIPDSFLDAFWGRGGADQGWCAIAHALFTERLKTDPRLRTVVFLDRLSDLRAIGLRNAEQLDRAIAEMSATNASLFVRFTALEAKMDDLAKRQADARIDEGELARMLLSGLSRGTHLEALARAAGMAFPRRPEWSQTGFQVRARIAALRMQPFFGRQQELSRLDKALEGADRGVWVLAGPAGSGKSALLAEWIDRRVAHGDIVARHFASTLFERTTAPAAVLGHLYVQATEADGQDAGPLPEDVGKLGEALHALLSQQRTSEDRLIVVLDGLDEALTEVLPFAEADLAKNVFVVVSGRAGADEHPPYLRRWEDRWPDLPGERFDLAGLQQAAVLAWLEEVIGHLDADEMRVLADRLHAASDGLPLFLRFIVDDLKESLRFAETREERLTIASDLPAPFTEYVRKQIDGMRQTKEVGWTPGLSALFALLARTFRPLLDAEIEGYFAHARRGDAAMPECPNLLGLHHRASRWLTIHQEARAWSFAFGHPRIAQAFDAAFGDAADEAETRLLAWSSEGWTQKNERRQKRAGSEYALDWLPAHFLRRAEYDRAVQVLSDSRFVGARLRDENVALSRLIRSADEWSQIPIGERCANPMGRWWVGLWGESESVLRRAAQQRVFGRTTSLDRFFQVARDSADSDQHRKLLRASGSEVGASNEITASHPSARSQWGLVRSIDDAHDGAIRGVAPVGDGLVSWGADGALRFWGPNGEARRGGAIDQHNGAVLGILVTSSRVISWSELGSLRFWGLDGNLLSGGSLRAHGNRIHGVLEISSGYVSWGDDGAFRFWGPEGELVPDGAIEAHETMFSDTNGVHHVLGVTSVLAMEDSLVTSGGDGMLRRWTLDGEPLPQDSHGVDLFGIEGMVCTKRGFVSWGKDSGVIAFWTHDGKEMRRVIAHERGMGGVLALDDCLASWGQDGAIRYWTDDGSVLERSAVSAHPGGVFGMLRAGETLVSWGADDTLKTWTLLGRKLNSVDLATDRTGYWRVHNLGDGLASSGPDNRIRLWTNSGDLTQVEIANPHRGYVSGVARFTEKIVTWGEDGAIRIWHPESLPADPNRRSDQPVRGLTSVGRFYVSWDDIGEVRCWNSDATPTRGERRSEAAGIVGIEDFGDRAIGWSGSSLWFWRVHDRGLDLLTTVKAPLTGCVVRIGDEIWSMGPGGQVEVWSLEGKPVDSFKLHMKASHDPRGALLLGQHLVTWGDRGALHWWELGARPVPLRTIDSNGRVHGALVLQEKLLNWSADGTMKLWDRNGDLVRTISRAHVDGVGEAVLVGNGFATFGGDGLIKRWDGEGEFLGQMRRPGVRGIAAVGDRLLSWGKDGLIEIWDAERQPRFQVCVPGGGGRLFVAANKNNPNTFFVFGRAAWAYSLPEGC